MASIVLEQQAQPVTNWAALAGRWIFEEDRATYSGAAARATTVDSQQSSSRIGLPFGLAVSDARLRDGSVSARMVLGASGESTAGIVLGYGHEQGYIAAQLGAYDSAYAISEYVPALGWRGLVVVGALSNLDRMVPHRAQVALRGQRITFAVNNVTVIDHLLPSPLLDDQVGLYAWGDDPVVFEDIAYVHRKPTAFIAMPFSEPFDTVYQEVIKPVVSELEIEVMRVDELAGPGVIFEDIKQQIENASIVIAEISAPNQNVYYELGYAHALKKPTILLARRGQELPFDIRSYRVIFYDDSIRGKTVVESELRRHLASVIGSILS